MGQFTITVKPEIIQARVQAAQTRDIDKLSSEFQLDKAQINGDGVDMEEASHLPYDAFMQLSGNDTKITKGDLLSFAKTPTEKEVVLEYARQISNSLPAQVMEASDDGAAQLNFKVVMRGQDIVVRAERAALSSPITSKTEATAAGVFSIIGGNDKDGDGNVAVGRELAGSVFVKTAGDAIKLAGSDKVVSPVEALTAIFEKAGKLPVSDINIQYGK